ncbi:hypothetical protein A6302_00600 [Methylobrevis pamukkalensis]|uniref:PepSY-associated TM helix n=2 Tax=Methylobrevis pamukkalensis TaxID=1439726 RepID=A0A1E3H7F3_9HYPH|nr:hypothetical protein A6302_00600 [Methylobrevis pamukkalensis]
MTLRTWHAWLSIALALPIVIVSITAILIAHDKDLGTKNVALTGPGEGAPAAFELKAFLETADGTRYYGTKYGLVAEGTGGVPMKVGAIGEEEVRDLAAADGTVFAAGKTGLWRAGRDGLWTQAMPGDVWSVSTSGAAIFAATKEQLWRSDDGGATFRPSPLADEALSGYAAVHGAPAYTLNKLVMDLHTGKLFFGKDLEWIWIDAIGAVMLFLSLSGVVIWRRAERRKALASAGSGAHAATG